MKKLISILILTVIASSAFCKTITVTSSADSGVGSLRQAVLDASANDTIVFDMSVSSITLSSVIKLEKDVTIIGDSSINTILSAPSSRHFVLPDMTVSGDTVRVILNNLALKDGYYSTCGGSILSDKNTVLYLNKCLFENNNAGSVCGTIFSYGILKVNNCLFKNNTCTGVSSVGAVFNGGQMYIYNSVFIGNQGMSSACLMNNNYAEIMNSLFFNNNTTKTNGGVIFNLNSKSTLAISNTTISDNIGIGIYATQGIKLYNSIVFNNTEYDILIDSISSIIIKNNLIGTSNINIVGSENILNTDPLFLGSGNYSLQANSPAIDTGDKSYLSDSITTDILGNVRMSNNKIDIGAYEYQATASNLYILKSDINIYSIGHTIYVDNTSSFLVSIYDMMGELLAQDNKSVFQVSHAGVYLVCINNTIQKVIVK